MNPFDRAFRHTVGIEGDYSDDPSDSGGKTRFGITESVARAFGYTGDMRELPFDMAKQIYRLNYWQLLKLDDVAWFSEPIAFELFDTAVNCSQSFAARSLQRALNALNRQGTDYPDLEVDGLIGQVTLGALGAYLNRRGKEGESVLLKALNCLQGTRYIGLAEKREKDEKFVYGWLRTRVAI